MQTSCGFLIQKDNEILLCHSTHPKKKAKMLDGRWGISKGGMERGETFLDAAKRETFEEIGLNVDDYSFKISLNYFAFIYASKKKKLIVFKLIDTNNVLDKFKFICNSYNKDLPEIDAFEWVDGKHSKDMIMDSQRPILDVEDDYWVY